MAKLVFDDAGQAQVHGQQHAKHGTNKQQQQRNGAAHEQRVFKRPAASQSAQGAGAKRHKLNDSKTSSASAARDARQPAAQRQKGAGQRQKGDDIDDEQYRRALARMEMGPDDDGDMSDLSDLEDDEQEAAEQHRQQAPVARPAARKAQPQPTGPTGKQQGKHKQVPAVNVSSGQGDGYLLEAEQDSDQERDNPAGENTGSEDSLGSEPSDADGSPHESDGREEVDEGMSESVESEKGPGSENGSEEIDSDELVLEPQKQLQRSKTAPKQRPQLSDSGDDDSKGTDLAGSGDDDSEEEEDDEAREAMQQLAELPLGQRLALLQDGSGPKGQVARAAAQAAKIQEQSFKRLNKHRPQEMSSKRPVTRFKQVVEPHKKPAADPRFSRLASDKEKEIAARRYAFLYDDVMAREKNELKARIKEERNPNAQAALSRQLQRLDQTLTREKQRRTHAELEQQVKAQQRASVAAGNKPFFLKDSDKKKLALVAKYQELKQKGQLDRYMEKRRKHNASKDHRYIPAGRRADQL